MNDIEQYLKIILNNSFIKIPDADSKYIYYFYDETLKRKRKIAKLNDNNLVFPNFNSEVIIVQDLEHNIIKISDKIYYDILNKFCIQNNDFEYNMLDNALIKIFNNKKLINNILALYGIKKMNDINNKYNKFIYKLICLSIDNSNIYYRIDTYYKINSQLQIESLKNIQKYKLIKI